MANKAVIQRKPVIYKKTDGYLMVYSDSSCACMSTWESFLYRWFNVAPAAFKKNSMTYTLSRAIDALKWPSEIIK